MKLSITTESSPQHGRWSGADKVAVRLQTRETDSAEEVQGMVGAVVALFASLSGSDFTEDEGPFTAESSGLQSSEDLRTATEAEADLNADRARTDLNMALRKPGESLSPRRVAEIGAVISEVLDGPQARPLSQEERARAIVFALDDRGMVR